MAEFCLECWNEINGTEDSERKYIISKDTFLCEHCGEWKPIIVMYRKAYYREKFWFFIWPFKVIHKIILNICWILEDIKWWN